MGKRPTPAMCGDLGVMGGLGLWWGWQKSREEGRAAKLGVVFLLVLSSSSSSSKYDPEILKAEIATTKSRVSTTNGPLLATSNLQIFPNLVANTKRRCQGG